MGGNVRKWAVVWTVPDRAELNKIYPHADIACVEAASVEWRCRQGRLRTKWKWGRGEDKGSGSGCCSSMSVKEARERQGGRRAQSAPALEREGISTLAPVSVKVGLGWGGQHVETLVKGAHTNLLAWDSPQDLMSVPGTHKGQLTINHP